MASSPVLLLFLSVCASLLRRFSHPVASVERSNFHISGSGGDGVIEAMNTTGPLGDLCGTFTMRAKVPFSPWATPQSSVGVTLKGTDVADVYGKTFPTFTQTENFDHRYLNVGMMSVGGKGLGCRGGGYPRAACLHLASVRE